MPTTPDLTRPRTTGHVFIATSVDGYIARANGEIDWLMKYAAGTEDTGYNAFMGSVDGVVMGRGTFEKVLSFSAWPFNKPVIVLSHSLSLKELRSDLDGKVQISSLAPNALMQALAADGWKRAYIDGGKVIQSFLRERLISDIVLTRVPVLLGDGIPLFGKLEDSVGLRHIETNTFASGLIQTKYGVDV